jgi:ketosteroid isomerase-like protein
MPLRAPAIALLALVLAGACAHRPPVSAAAERAALETRQAAFLTALAARDAERTAAHFADDAVLHVAGMPPIRGRAAIHRFYGNVFRFMRASSSTPELLRMSHGADMAFSTGRVTNVFDGADGPVEHAGKFLLVWEKRGGEWAIAVYGISSDRPDANR